MRQNAFKTILPTLLVLMIATGIVAAQDEPSEPQTRSITSDDFSKRPREGLGRPGRSGPRAGGTTTTKKTAVPYKFVRKDKSSIRWKAAPKVPVVKPQPKGPTVTTDIGVTIWKLRPPRPSDSGVKLPVKTDDARQEMWTPERVSVDTAFRAGDRIRMAVESPSTGYVYIINSEMNANGSLGPPRLIFPDPVSQSNKVDPGILVDVPDHRDELPYFRLKANSGDYAGELIAIVVTAKPLPFEVDGEQHILNIDTVLDLDAGLDFEVFARTDAGDKVFSHAEAGAACGSKTRDLVREKAGPNPCGEKTRELTRDEPQPQAVYRVKTYQGRPAVAILRLTAQN